MLQRTKKKPPARRSAPPPASARKSKRAAGKSRARAPDRAELIEEEFKPEEKFPTAAELEELRAKIKADSAAWEEEQRLELARYIQETTSTPEGEIDFLRRGMLDVLDWLEEEFAEGKGRLTALPEAVARCAAARLPMPDWVAKHFSERWHKVVRRWGAGSWDEVLGRPHPKGTRLATRLKHFQLKFDIYKRIESIIQQDPRIAIDDNLFDRIGAEFRVGKTVCKELYYKGKLALDYHYRQSKKAR